MIRCSAKLASGAAVVFMLAGLVAGAGDEGKEIKMEIGRYGFRHDPMKWVESSKSLQAAQVRTVIFAKPQAGDADLLAKEIDRILSLQQDDGQLADNTPGNLIRLSRLGCSPDRPEIKRAVAAMCQKSLATEGHEKDKGELGCYDIQAAAWGNYGDKEVLKTSVRIMAERVMTMNFWHACPWSGEIQLQALWDGREHADVSAALEHGLKTLNDGIEQEACWPNFLDPWGWLDCAGRIDHPLAKRLMIKMLPFILRAQHDDGTWGGMGHLGYGPGDRTFLVLRGLARHELLEPLRQLPPLPPDWKVGRTIQAPDGDYQTMTWDGRQFWLYDRKTGEAVAVTAADGKVAARVKLPTKVTGIGSMDGKLLVVREKPKTLLLIDPASGKTEKTLALKFWGDAGSVTQVGDQLAVGNVHCGGANFVTTFEDKKFPHRQFGASAPVDMAGDGDTIWHIDDFSPVIIKNTLDKEHTRRLDWGGNPFAQHTTGIAFDGANLWVLDNKHNQICMIEKSAEPTVSDDKQ
ncbi:YncE family protein [Candidatus Sumerlaeota bacterium]